MKLSEKPMSAGWRAVIAKIAVSTANAATNMIIAGCQRRSSHAPGRRNAGIAKISAAAAATTPLSDPRRHGTTRMKTSTVQAGSTRSDLPNVPILASRGTDDGPLSRQKPRTTAAERQNTVLGNS